MRITTVCITLILLSSLVPSPVFAATNNLEITQFTSTAVNTLTVLVSLVASLFLILGGYTYIISAGKPDALESAKKTIRNALIGLVLVLYQRTSNY